MNDIIYKIAESIQLSFEVPNSEKKKASILIENIRVVLNALDKCSEYLNTIYEPFKSATELSEDDILNYRGALYRYKNEIKEKYNKIKEQIAFIISQLLFFDDLTIKEFVSSLKGNVEDVENNVESLMQALNDPKIPDFKNSIIKTIETIFSESLQLKKFLEERVIGHINKNILGDNWFEKIHQQSKKVDHNLAPIMKLYQQRQEILEGQ